MNSELIKELEKKREELVNEVLQMSVKTLYHSASEYAELAVETAYLDGLIDGLNDTIFYLKEGIWESEITTTINKI